MGDAGGATVRTEGISLRPRHLLLLLQMMAASDNLAAGTLLQILAEELGRVRSGHAEITHQMLAP